MIWSNESLTDAQNFTNGLNALNDFALQVKLNNNKKGFLSGSGAPISRPPVSIPNWQRATGQQRAHD